jgi:hypothetical protein
MQYELLHIGSLSGRCIQSCLQGHTFKIIIHLVSCTDLLNLTLKEIYAKFVCVVLPCLFRDRLIACTRNSTKNA